MAAAEISSPRYREQLRRLQPLEQQPFPAADVEHRSIGLKLVKITDQHAESSQLSERVQKVPMADLVLLFPERLRESACRPYPAAAPMTAHVTRAYG